MLPGLYAFIKARDIALRVDGFTDNAGAIHSIERIVDLLGRRRCYPEVGGIADLKKGADGQCPCLAFGIEMSRKAHDLWDCGERDDLRIEHVMPKRAFALDVVAKAKEFAPDKGAQDLEVLRFIEQRYRLFVLTKAQMSALNKQNRSKVTENRIKDAGIEPFCPHR